MGIRLKWGRETSPRARAAGLRRPRLETQPSRRLRGAAASRAKRRKEAQTWRNFRMLWRSSVFTSSGTVAARGRWRRRARRLERARRRRASAARRDLRDELVDGDLLEALAPDHLCDRGKPASPGGVRARARAAVPGARARRRPLSGRAPRVRPAGQGSRAFAVLLELVAPAALDELLPQELLEALLLAGLDELLHNRRTHGVILLLPLGLRAMRRGTSVRVLRHARGRDGPRTLPFRRAPVLSGGPAVIVFDTGWAGRL